MALPSRLFAWKPALLPREEASPIGPGGRLRVGTQVDPPRVRSAPRFPRLARAGSTLAVALLAACTTFPTVMPETARAAGNSREVRIDGPHGPLSEAARQRVLGRLQAQGQDTGIFDRHLAFEQEITGTPLSAGNGVELLQDGPATYQSMFDAMSQAVSTIDMETYIFEDDEVGQRFAHELEAAAARGLTVNLIYDSAGSVGTPRSFFDDLGAHGVHTLEFNPVNPLAARRGWEVNQRDHRKLTVIDGKVAFLGGINISSVYAGGSFSRASARTPGHGQKVPWRDTDLRIEGPAVADFQKLFVETWRRQAGDKGPPLAPADYFPQIQPAGNAVVRAIGGTPTEPYSQIYATLISALRSSETSILLANAYFDPDPQLLQAIEDAARRGVDVQLLLPTISDTWMVEAAGRRHFGRLLEAGVKIYQRKGALLHSKTTLIDGVWAAIGSTNLDWRSFLHNDEIDAIVLNVDFGDRMKAAFEHDLAQSTRLTLEDWRHRPMLERLQESIARVWEYWL